MCRLIFFVADIDSARKMDRANIEFDHSASMWNDMTIRKDHPDASFGLSELVRTGFGTMPWRDWGLYLPQKQENPGGYISNRPLGGITTSYSHRLISRCRSTTGADISRRSVRT